ncbi:transcriptional regulator [Spirochaeta africana DSM 8902]|uniref:Transcriptional regulator n=1 Tax=Spirochaeta africana (strain ATCC 700263 / DSM 8902 / Z-7692) TaxID=889378 RepID=H9UH03_SPIAZ|nr:transcriptional regulator [Spirochaeta africana DSM 8902]
MNQGWIVAPKKSITEQDIILTAFHMIRTMGTRSVTARKIALEIGCSTMPLYSTVGSMQDLNIRVMEIGYILLEQLRQRIHSGCPLLDLQLAMYQLAEHEPHLWRLMFLNSLETAREPQFSEWRRLVQDIEESLPGAGSLADPTRIQQLQDVSYALIGVCASINLGTFFYLQERPQDQASYITQVFSRLNTGLIPWYTPPAAKPAGLDQALQSALDTTIELCSTPTTPEAPDTAHAVS